VTEDDIMPSNLRPGGTVQGVQFTEMRCTAHIQTKRSVSRFQFSTGADNDAAIRASVSDCCVPDIEHVIVNAVPVKPAHTPHSLH